ncbi:MAG: hypothetical protein ACXADY_11955 [Candidatus Hodarchaeales archaeon]|jgi:hypothetical protein
MRIQEQWALFVEGTQIKWSFGNPSSEFQETVSNFLMGLGNLGKELFGEGIASINFDLRKHSGMKASEVFIVSLQDQFFLIISDPAVTLMLITVQGGIPEDIKEIMTAVLVGQASVLYANSISEANSETKTKIEMDFQGIIMDINPDYQDETLNAIVGTFGSNFSILSFEECLLLHYYLRKHAERSTYASSAGWAMIANLEGWEIPLSYNLTKEGIWAGFFAAIVGFIYSLFESKPKYISFGSTEIQKLRFIYGEKYFMAIDTSFVSDLLLKKDFQKELFSTSYKILRDMSSGIKDLIVEEILQYNEEKLTQLSVETLLDTYVGTEETLELTRDERMIRVWGKLLLSFQQDKERNI